MLLNALRYVILATKRTTFKLTGSGVLVWERSHHPPAQYFIKTFGLSATVQPPEDFSN